MKENKMRGNCKAKCGMFIVWAVAGIALGGAAVMVLWNCLTPTIFGWKEIGYVQAIEVLILSRILFGRWGHCGKGCASGDASSCSTTMTAEEREQLDAKVKSKWCCK
jgi:hypothetical protein